MSKATVVVKRNPSYQKGMYGLSIHQAPGHAANLIPIDSEEELRLRLLGFGFTARLVSDLIDLLQKQHDSVTINVASPT